MKVSRGRNFLVKIGAFLAFAAFMALSSGNCAHAALAVETHDLITFEYQQTGANEEEAVRLAGIRAVNATIGRLMFSDYSLQARDLLDPYIQKNWNKYVASSYVLERRAEQDGFGVRIRIQTTPEILGRDLREKRFLYLPHANPYHYVFLAETLNGGLASSDLGRRAVIDAIINEGGKVYESGVQVPPNNTDVVGSSDLGRFAAAREAAARIGAEVIISGRADTRLVDKRDIYYDKFSNYETKVHLDMVRVDDGALLGSSDSTMRASDVSADVARDDSIRTAVQSATDDLIERTKGLWKKTTGDKSKFSLMFTDLSPEELDEVARYLQSELGYGTKVRLRTYYGGTAVVGVDTERAYAAVDRAIENYHAFDLRVTDRQGSRITVDVKH